MSGVNTFSSPGLDWAGTRDLELPVARPEERGERVNGYAGPQAAGRLPSLLPAVSDPSCWGGRADLMLALVRVRVRVLVLCGSTVLSSHTHTHAHGYTRAHTHDCNEAVCRLD